MHQGRMMCNNFESRKFFFLPVLVGPRPFPFPYLAFLSLPSIPSPPSRTTNNSYNWCIGQFVTCRLTLFCTGLFYGQVCWQCDMISTNVLLRDNSKFVALHAPSGMSRKLRINKSPLRSIFIFHPLFLTVDGTIQYFQLAVIISNQ